MDYTVPTLYPQPYWPPILAAEYLVSIAILGGMISKRFPGWKSWAQIPVPQIIIFILIVDSFFFVFSAALFTLGIGTSRNTDSCSGGLWMCVIFFATTKAVISVFLMERLHIVHGVFKKRLDSNLYKINCGIVLIWVGVLITFMVRHWTYIRDSDGQCIYHIGHEVTFMTGALEVVIDIWFCVLFAWPLARGSFSTPALKRVALLSVIGAAVSMASSCANMFIFSIFNGKELGFVCLASCALDALINCGVLYWVTSGQSREGRITATTISTGHRASISPTHHIDFTPTPFQLNKSEERPTSLSFPPSPVDVEDKTVSSSEREMEEGGMDVERRA
ncbi:hypothetical protein T439DRAFT_61665 [Meredithblackwellia eburnea MCA 4105]